MDDFDPITAALLRAGRLSVTDLLLAREARASVALDRDDRAQTHTINTEEDS